MSEATLARIVRFARIATLATSPLPYMAVGGATVLLGAGAVVFVFAVYAAACLALAYLVCLLCYEGASRIVRRVYSCIPTRGVSRLPALPARPPIVVPEDASAVLCPVPSARYSLPLASNRHLCPDCLAGVPLSARKTAPLACESILPESGPAEIESAIVSAVESALSVLRGRGELADRVCRIETAPAPACVECGSASGTTNDRCRTCDGLYTIERAAPSPRKSRSRKSKASETVVASAALPASDETPAAPLSEQCGPARMQAYLDSTRTEREEARAANASCPGLARPDCSSLSRRELQGLAKQYGVKANLSSAAILDALCGPAR